MTEVNGTNGHEAWNIQGLAENVVMYVKKIDVLRELFAWGRRNKCHARSYQRERVKTNLQPA
ncbi:hypothetical protein [Burkholderia sp. L27(2015)]|uniref:hypothetical protein n=1 Tax=Burkholderia sp. L27(2015) TaxID=1641858 RepID=UPI00131E6EDE|nr:hypothetical protein [Burkholderia sp. L27(2015)]